MEEIVLIWDGEHFLEVPKREAKALVKADKCQIMDGTEDGLSLKDRSQFTGYSTPEPQTMIPIPTEKAEAVHNVTSKAPLKDWRVYRKIAAEKLGIAYNKTTKADVMKYLEDADGHS